MDVTSSSVQLALSQGIVCVCVCVCKATLGLFPVFFECCVLLQRKAGLTELRLSAYLPFTGGPPQPFSPSASDLHTHTHKKPRNTRTNTRMCLCNVDTLTLPQEAAVSAADFHAFKSIPLWSMILGRECVCE